MDVIVRCISVKNDHLLLCYNKKGEFYFFPGGKLEYLETVNQCIVREFAEEAGIAPDKIHIHSGEKLFENIFEIDGEKFHDINIVKQVDLDVAKVESIEDHISFAEFPLSSLPDKLYPVAIKDYVLKTFSPA